MKANDPRKQVREKPGDLAQEGAFGFYPSKLLKECEGEDLGVREMLEGMVRRRTSRVLRDFWPLSAYGASRQSSGQGTGTSLRARPCLPFRDVHALHEKPKAE